MVMARSIVAALALMPASALAQNSYSFTNAGESMVRYSVASTQAAMGCDPGVPEPSPPEQPDPGGVSCTMRTLSLITVSWSTLNPSRSA